MSVDVIIFCFLWAVVAVYEHFCKSAVNHISTQHYKRQQWRLDNRKECNSSKKFNSFSVEHNNLLSFGCAAGKTFGKLKRELSQANGDSRSTSKALDALSLYSRRLQTCTARRTSPSVNPHPDARDK